jgi:hypothetical protein
MNVEIGAEAALIPEKEYIYGIAVAVYFSLFVGLNVQIQLKGRNILQQLSSSASHWLFRQTEEYNRRTSCFSHSFSKVWSAQKTVQ